MPGVAPGTAWHITMAFHVGVRGESNQLGDGGFRLGHEVIGVRIGDDVLGAILFQRLFGGAEFFLALAGGAGENGNLPSTLIRSFQPKPPRWSG